jgi:hypothetical protein
VEFWGVGKNIKYIAFKNGSLSNVVVEKFKNEINYKNSFLTAIRLWLGCRVFHNSKVCVS